MPWPTDPDFWDPRVSFPGMWKIRPKEGGEPIEFRLWGHQEILAAMLLRCYAENKWLAHAKPRKEGSSTLWLGVALQHVMFRYGVTAGILTHEKDTSEELSSIAIRMHRHCPPQIKRRKHAGTKKVLKFPDIESKMELASIAEPEPLRGNTGVQVLVASEVSAYGAIAKDTSAKFAAIMSNVPEDGGFVIQESTPRYYGDELHLTFQDATNNPNSRYLKCFIPWTHVADYSRTPPPKWQMPEAVADYAHKWDLTLEQAYWLASFGLEKCGRSWEKFRAEYPIDEEDCWLLAGESVFHRDNLLQMRKSLDDGTGLAEIPMHQWTFWEKPWQNEEYADHRYVIFVDPAGSWSKRDLFAAEVMNMTELTQAGEYLGHTNAHSFARELCKVGTDFGKCPIYVEANGVGEALLSHLIELGYPRVYHRRQSSSLIGAKQRGDFVPGWHANKKTKTEAVSITQEYIADGSLKLRSPRAITQLLNYRGQWDRLRNDRDTQGGHFDLVAAICGCCWAHRYEFAGRFEQRPKTLADSAKAAWDRIQRELRAHERAGGSNLNANSPWGRHL